MSQLRASGAALKSGCKTGGLQQKIPLGEITFILIFINSLVAKQTQRALVDGMLFWGSSNPSFNWINLDIRPFSECLCDTHLSLVVLGQIPAGFLGSTMPILHNVINAQAAGRACQPLSRYLCGVHLNKHPSSERPSHQLPGSGLSAKRTDTSLS